MTNTNQAKEPVYTYKWIDARQTHLERSDGTIIPIGAGNRDYDKFIADKSNAEPYVDPTLENQ